MKNLTQADSWLKLISFLIGTPVSNFEGQIEMLKNHPVASAFCSIVSLFVAADYSVGQSISPIVFSGLQLDSDRTIVGVALPHAFTGSDFCFSDDQILFLAEVDDGSTGQSNNTIFAGSVSEYKEIARNGQVIPGDDRTLSIPFPTYRPGGISPMGNATFVCRDSTGRDVLLHYRDDSLSVLLHEGELTPDGTARPDFVWRYTYTEEGNFAAFADVFGLADGRRQVSLFQLRDGALQEVARTNRDFGDSGITTDFYGIVPFGALGLSKNNDLIFPFGGRDNAQGFLVFDENVNLIDQFGTTFRLTADDDDFCEINAQGTIIFSADRRGYYIRHGEIIDVLFRVNDQVPSGDGEFGSWSGNYGREANFLNESNEVAFSAYLLNTSLAQENNKAVFRYSSETGLVEVVRKSEPLPDRLGNFTSMDVYDFNDQGQVLLGGTVGNSGLVGDFGFYLHQQDGSFTSIVKRNDQLLGSTVVNVTGLLLNEQDQVAFGFLLADGTEGIAVWDPNLFGDFNEDGVVNFSDIPSFIDLLINSEFLVQGDLNQDGSVDFADIPPFIDLLVNLP